MEQRHGPGTPSTQVGTIASTRENTSPDDTWERDWGLFLRLARQVAGLSLTELAERTRLSKGYLSKLESGAPGARNPSRATLAALARALPSFRALAHMLDPDLAPTPLAPTAQLASNSARLGSSDAVATSNSPSHVDSASSESPMDPPAPLRLGWRELEVVLVVLALDRVALPMPLSALALARAAERPVLEVRPILDRLCAEGVLLCEGPLRPDGLPTYAPSPTLARRLGISRVGDALVLAAALLGGATTQNSRRGRQQGGEE